MTENLKRQFKLESRGIHKCHKCHGQRKGEFVVFCTRLTKAVDGSLAARIYFVCREKGHITFVGYSKPVDFNLNLPKGDFDDRDYEDEENEIEAEWNEMVLNASKQRRTFYGSH